MSLVTVAIIAVVSGSLGFLTASLLASAKALEQRPPVPRRAPAHRLSAPSQN